LTVTITEVFFLLHQLNPPQILIPDFHKYLYTGVSSPYYIIMNQKGSCNSLITLSHDLTPVTSYLSSPLSGGYSIRHQQIPIHVKTSQAAKLPVLPTYCSTLKMEAPAPLKFWYLSTRLHGAMSKRTVILVLSAKEPQTLH
jgi:hypothetical protein